MIKISSSNSLRITMLKLISIVMVVFIHSYRTGNSNLFFFNFEFTIVNILSRVAVPLFFLISSYLLYLKPFNWGKNLRKKTKTLLIPYILVNTIWILLFLIIGYFSFVRQYLPSDGSLNFNIYSWRIKDWISYYFYYPFDYPLWFLKDLFILNIFSRFIKNIVDRFPTAILIIISIIWIGGIWLPNPVNILNLNMQSFVFFVLGYYAAKFRLEFENVDRLNKYGVITAYIFSSIIVLLFKNIYALSAVNILIGIVFWIRISIYFSNKNKELLKYQSKFSMLTFFIFAFHELTLGIIVKFTSLIYKNNNILEFIFFIANPIIVISICILLANIITKISPRVASVISGNRV
ncbi:acyltransferase family protein [Enterococcus innesii]|uniref:acyltransferase family protein n=1 Tax=Enterococcus innesii TaxID=2839759 RepID=UPI003D0CE49E